MTVPFDMDFMDFDVVCFSHLDWDSVFQRPHHLMTRWARERRVFFIQGHVLDDDGTSVMEQYVSAEGVRVARPHRPLVIGEDEVIALKRRLVDELFAEHGIREYVLWYYDPLAIRFTRHLFTQNLRPLACVYDCMDHLAGFHNAHPQIETYERQLLDRADLVFAGGASLYELMRPLHPRVSVFPSSADVAHFARSRLVRYQGAPAADPADQAGILHPRLGFAGVIDERLDAELLRGVVGLRPAWQLVLLGPVMKVDPATLPASPNVHYLGQKAYDQLPDYMAGWDAALIPFAPGRPATRYISPTKTLEYLAAGLPVISTSIRDVVRPYGEQGLVRIADAPSDFVAAVEVALAEDPSARLQVDAGVDAVLRSTSWDATWAEMRAQVLQVIADRTPAREDRREDRREDHVMLAASRQSTQAGHPAVAGAARPFDYLVVGAGFAGSVIAERLASQLDQRVLVVERRDHIGGNAYDCYDDAGVLIHKYGPHIFHTNSAEIFAYLSQFTEWRPYEHRVLASVDGKLLPVPINLDTVNRLYGWDLTPAELEVYLQHVAQPREPIRTAEDVVLARVGRDLYEKFFKNYTRKQWGIEPSALDAAVTARIPVRTNHDDRYFTDRFQAMPREGYTRLFERMLAHPNIELLLGADYRSVRDAIPHRAVIYTGPIDEFFDYRFGRLPYRSLEFRFETLDLPPGSCFSQLVAVINYPNEHEYTRVTEFKHLTGQVHQAGLRRTTRVYEYPRAQGDPYYPVPRPENTALYKRYEALAHETPEGPCVHFVGRLATYKYYNMDQVVGQALALAKRIRDLTAGREPFHEVEELLSAPSVRSSRRAAHQVHPAVDVTTGVQP